MRRMRSQERTKNRNSLRNAVHNVTASQLEFETVWADRFEPLVGAEPQRGCGEAMSRVPANDAWATAAVALVAAFPTQLSPQMAAQVLAGTGPWNAGPKLRDSKWWGEWREVPVEQLREAVGAAVAAGDIGRLGSCLVPAA